MFNNIKILLAFAIGLSALSLSSANAQDDKATLNKIRAKLYELTVEQKQAKSKYGDKHPKIAELNSKIAFLQGLIADDKMKVEKKKIEVDKLAAKLADMQAEMATLNAQRADLLSRYGKLHPKTRQIDSSIVHYRAMIDKLKQSRAAIDLTTQEKNDVIDLTKNLANIQRQLNSRQDQLSADEKAIQAQVEKLRSMQKAAEAKNVMERLLKNEKLIQNSLANQQQQLDSSKRYRQEAEKALKDAMSQRDLQQALIARKNAELDAMNAKLKSTQNYLAQLQKRTADQAKKATNLADSTKAKSNSVERRIDELSARMNRVEKLLQKIADKIDKDR